MLLSFGEQKKGERCLRCVPHQLSQAGTPINTLIERRVACHDAVVLRQLCHSPPRTSCMPVVDLQEPGRLTRRGTPVPLELISTKEEARLSDQRWSQDTRKRPTLFDHFANKDFRETSDNLSNIHAWVRPKCRMDELHSGESRH